MDFQTKTINSYLTNKLRERVEQPIVNLGSDRFLAVQFASRKCINFVAARRLNATLADLQVRDTRDLFERVAPVDLALPGIGSVALAVLGTCFELKRIGGEHPLDAWFERHADAGRKLVTFDSVKHRKDRDADAARAEKRAAARRRRARSESATT